jgi:hypothetical protein
MAISEPYTGTVAVSSVEWSMTSGTSALGAITDDGIYQLWLDQNDMILADELEVRLYEKVRSGDTQRQVHMWKFKHAQTDKNWVSPTVILIHGWEMTLKATVGTITVLWSIRKIA